MGALLAGEGTLIATGISLCAVVLTLIGGGIGFGVYLHKWNKKHPPSKADRAKYAPVDWNEPTLEPQPTFKRAKVIAKRIENPTDPLPVIMALPIERSYLVTFLCGEEKIELAVPPEFWEKVAEGQEGTLVMINGAFFDFGEGDDIVAGEEDI